MNIDEMIKAEQKEYYKNYRKRNPDKIKQANKKYWENRVLKKLQSAESGDKTKHAE